jgi:hypothetical protein
VFSKVKVIFTICMKADETWQGGNERILLLLLFILQRILSLQLQMQYFLTLFNDSSSHGSMSDINVSSLHYAWSIPACWPALGCTNVLCKACVVSHIKFIAAK